MPAIVRLVIAIAAQRSWPIHQLDVNNVFLQGNLKEDIPMRLPPESSQHSIYICKLKKVIYGLRQAPTGWYIELTTYLTSIGFVKSKSNLYLLILHNCSVTIYILIYVDDIIIMGSIQGSVRAVITSLFLQFSLKVLSLLHYFLGTEVISTPTAILLSQQKFVMDLQDELYMIDCKGVPTPMTLHPR